THARARVVGDDDVHATSADAREPGLTAPGDLAVARARKRAPNDGRGVRVAHDEHSCAGHDGPLGIARMRETRRTFSNRLAFAECETPHRRSMRGRFARRFVLLLASLACSTRARRKGR